MKHKGVGSIIGITFLLLIVSTGYSYYLVRNQATSRLESIENEMQEYENKVNSEKLEILSVELTPSNGLNLIVENSGNEFSTLSWIGVEDLSKNNLKYYGIDIQISPKTTETSITNSSILLDPDKEYLIQVMTLYGNQYYIEYPEETISNSTSAVSDYYYDYSSVDLHPGTSNGTHSFFAAMKGVSDGLVNSITEVNLGALQSNTHSFDATGGYMVIGNGFTDWGSSSGTISFWIKWDIMGDRPWGQHQNMETRISGNRLVLDWAGTSSLISSTSFSTGQWYFIAITWNQATNNLRLYVGDDSTSPSLDASTGSWGGSVTSVGVTRNNFMASRNGVGTVDGHGDDLRYYDTDRNQAEIQSDYATELSGSETNLRSYYKLNNDFNDIGPDNNDGSGSGGYSFSVDIPISSSSYCLDLEVQWSDLPQHTYEYLSIYCGTQGLEDLKVDVWNLTQYENLITDLQPGWNHVNISSYHNGSEFNIRFKDAVQTPDSIQDSWEIDLLTIHLWDD